MLITTLRRQTSELKTKGGLLRAFHVDGAIYFVCLSGMSFPFCKRKLPVVQSGSDNSFEPSNVDWVYPLDDSRPCEFSQYFPCYQTSDTRFPQEEKGLQLIAIQ